LVYKSRLIAKKKKMGKSAFNHYVLVLAMVTSKKKKCNHHHFATKWPHMQGYRVHCFTLYSIIKWATLEIVHYIGNREQFWTQLSFYFLVFLSLFPRGEGCSGCWARVIVHPLEQICPCIFPLFSIPVPPSLCRLYAALN